MKLTDSSSSRRRRPASPAPTFSQAQLRERRRHRQSVVLGGDFNLTAEIEAVCSPLACRVAALPRPLLAGVWVEELVEATHELVSTVVGWLAKADAVAKTQHLACDPGQTAKRDAAAVQPDQAAAAARDHRPDAHCGVVGAVAGDAGRAGLRAAGRDAEP